MNYGQSYAEDESGQRNETQEIRTATHCNDECEDGKGYVEWESVWIFGFCRRFHWNKKKTHNKNESEGEREREASEFSYNFNFPNVETHSQPLYQNCIPFVAFDKEKEATR